MEKNEALRYATAVGTLYTQCLRFLERNKRGASDRYACRRLQAVIGEKLYIRLPNGQYGFDNRKITALPIDDINKLTAKVVFANMPVAVLTEWLDANDDGSYLQLLGAGGQPSKSDKVEAAVSIYLKSIKNQEDEKA